MDKCIKMINVDESQRTTWVKKAPSRCSSGLRHILLPQATAKRLLTKHVGGHYLAR
jgi:hypothetical protein